MQNSLLRTNEELSQIYYRHVKTVYRVCFVFMKNEHDTKDMVQNTFIRLMKDGTQFQSDEHEKAWLIRTATNLCKDHFRNWWTKIMKIDYVAEVENVTDVKNTDVTDIANVTDVTVEQFCDSSDILEKVMALPSKYKTTIYMYYYEGYSTVEIARILNKKESTIRGYLYTGRKLLKIEMEGDLN